MHIACVRADVEGVPLSSRRIAIPTESNLVVVILLGAGIVVSVMQTLIVPIIGRLPALLDTNIANASWVVTVTLLTSAVTTPVFGRLGDMYGKRRMLLVCNAALLIGSLICALTDSLALMLVGRALQGAGIPMIPLGISLMRDVLTARRLPSAVALMSASLGIGGALALPASAALAEAFGWRSLFWVSAGLAVALAVLIATRVPESPERVRADIDWFGIVGLSTGLIAYLVAVSKGGDWGWTSPLTVGFLVVCVATLLVWGRWELRIPSPLVDLRTSARRPVLFTNLTAVIVCCAMYTMSLLSPQILQAPASTGYGMGRGLTATGLWMAPGGLVMILVSQVAARFIRLWGPRQVLALGAATIAVSNVVGQVALGTNPWGILVFSVVGSSGVAFAFAAMPMLIMGSVPPGETAAANGLNALARSLGTSTASALVGLILGQLTIQVAGLSYPSEAGMRLVLGIGAVIGVIALGTALLIPRGTALAPPAAVEETPQRTPTAPQRTPQQSPEGGPWPATTSSASSTN